MDIPFKYFPEDRFQQCVVLLSPSTAVSYDWKVLADRLGAAQAQINFFEAEATPRFPAVAQALRWFQGNNGTLGTLVEVLRRFPRNDVISILLDENVHEEMRERQTRGPNGNPMGRPMPTESPDPSHAFRLEGNENNNASGVSCDADGKTMHFSVTGPNIVVNIYNESEGRSSVDARHPNVQDAPIQNGIPNGRGRPSSSGGSTPSSEDSPPQVCRPKVRKGDGTRRPSGGSAQQDAAANSGRRHGGQSQGPNSPDASPPWNFPARPRLDSGQPSPPRPAILYRRQPSNGSIESYESVLPGHGHYSPPDSDSDLSSLNSLTLRQLDEPQMFNGQLQWNRPDRTVECTQRSGGPMFDTNAGAPLLRPQISEQGTEWTRPRARNKSETSRTVIDGPVLMPCSTKLLRCYTDFLTALGKLLRQRFRTADRHNPVQFSLWGTDRCIYSINRDVGEDIMLSLERSSIITIFADRRYLKVVQEVENQLRQNPNFVPEIDRREGHTHVNPHFLYFMLRSKFQKLKNKVVVFVKDNVNEELPHWLLSSCKAVARWPRTDLDFLNIILPLLNKQAKLIRRQYSTP